MKTQYYTASSLDGFIATEDDSLEWLFPLADLNETSYPDFITGVGAVAMGSATYEWIIRNSDTVAAETGSPWPYTQPVWVFTSRVLPIIEGSDIRWGAETWRGNFMMQDCWMNSSSRLAQLPWVEANNCFRAEF